MPFIAAGIGAAIWVGITLISGKPEAWDSSLYGMFGLPAMIGVSGLLGYLAPRHAWRWGVLMVASQPVAMVLMAGVGAFIGLGLLFFIVLSVPCVIAAYAGALTRRRLTSSAKRAVAKSTSQADNQR